MNLSVSFFTHHWIIGIIVVILVVSVIFALIRAAIKIAIVLLIIGIILITIFGLSPNTLLGKGKTAVDGMTSFYHQKIEPNLTHDINQADVHVNPDGKFTFNTPKVTITGEKGDQRVTLTYDHKTYTMNISQFNNHIKQTINDYIKQNSN